MCTLHSLFRTVASWGNFDKNISVRCGRVNMAARRRKVLPLLSTGNQFGSPRLAGSLDRSFLRQRLSRIRELRSVVKRALTSSRSTTSSFCLGASQPCNASNSLDGWPVWFLKANHGETPILRNPTACQKAREIDPFTVGVGRAKHSRVYDGKEPVSLDTFLFILLRTALSKAVATLCRRHSLSTRMLLMKRMSTRSSSLPHTPLPLRNACS